MCCRIESTCGHHHSHGWYSSQHHEPCTCMAGCCYRHVPGREEIIADLEENLRWLREEAERVQQRLAEMRGSG